MSELRWQTERLYFQHQNYFDNLVGAIRNATDTIELETYIFDCDRVGKLVLDELKSAAKRGVRVRVMVDGFGSFFEISKILSVLSGSSVQLKAFHPFFFPQATKFKWLRWDLIFQALSQWNRRLHRKICLIDKQILFLGSFNITDNSNRETGARVTGQAALEMLKVFEITWDRARKIRLKYSKLNDTFSRSSPLRLNFNRKIRKATRQDLCQKIAAARRRVWITNAYFVPPPTVLKAILTARSKGVDVEILVPAYSDPRFMKLLTETYYRGLLSIGVKFFEYQNNFLHAKSLLIDDWAIVGSSNMNYRSFFHDLEVDIVLTHEDSLLSLEEQFAIDRSKSKPVALESLVQRPLFDRIFTWLLYFLRDLL